MKIGLKLIMRFLVVALLIGISGCEPAEVESKEVVTVVIAGWNSDITKVIWKFKETL